MGYVKTYAMIFGWVFIAVGLIGFAITGFGGFFAMGGDRLLFFGINPAHNVVHLLLGAVYLVGARASEPGVTAVVVTLSVAYLLVGVLGLVLIDTPANIMAINQADNVLHLGTGALGLAVVAMARGGRRETASV
jgi:hypothetical protein